MTSSLTRLTSLPGIFHTTDVLMRCGVPKDQVNQLLWRWKRAGHVQSLGDRSDVWFNLVLDKEVSRERWERAVTLAMPTAIAAGHGVLMRSGLSTQMTNADYLIRPARAARASIDGASVHERPAVWIRHLRRAGAVQPSAIERGLAQLDPGAAALDMLAFDPDGIDAGEIDWEALDAASVELCQQLLPLAQHFSPANLEGDRAEPLLEFLDDQEGRRQAQGRARQR